MTKVEITIQNMVASVDLKCTIPLERVAAGCEDAEFNPEQFPGLVLRINEPKTANLLFGSGKMVCTGGKSLEDVEKAVNNVKKLLEEYGVEYHGPPEITVQNIVSSVETDLELNLDRLAYKLEGVEYEPEQFPGMVFRILKPKTAILMFSTGKFVVTGAKTPEEIEDAFNQLLAKLREIGEI